MMGIVVPLILLLLPAFSTDSFARRAYIPPEQKAQLSRIHTIWVSALALSEKLGIQFDDLSRSKRKTRTPTKAAKG